MRERRDEIEIIEAKKKKNVFVYVKHKSFVFSVHLCGATGCERV